MSGSSSVGDKLASVLSEIPREVWDRVVMREPEWINMYGFLPKYGFGKFCVVMVAAGLNDFQLKGSAEVAYWPKIREVLLEHPVPETLAELESILKEFYKRERLAKLKISRLNRFLSSQLARKLWCMEPKAVAEKFLEIWYDLAATMRQERNMKTIVFAMKCLGLALLMAGYSDFKFEKIPIPVDYRVKLFTRKLGVPVRSDEDVRCFWANILSKIRKNVNINMIHLDSLIWQIGKLNRYGILHYFRELGIANIGVRLLEVIK